MENYIAPKRFKFVMSDIQKNLQDIQIKKYNEEKNQLFKLTQSLGLKWLL